MSQEERLFRYMQNLRVKQENPAPHAIAYTRREFLANAIRMGFSVSAIAAVLAACDDDTPTSGSGGDSGASATLTRAAGATTASPAASPAANVPLPEITSIPENLKGSGQVRVVSFGGAFQEAQRRAYFEPFQRLSGIRVIEAEGPDSARIKEMVDTRSVEWDVVEDGRNTVMNLERQGQYWEPINYDLVDTDNIDAAFRYPLSLDMLPYAQIYAYRTDAFDGNKPNGWKDFWDTQEFPGARTMPGGTGTWTPDLEAASFAAGATKQNLYPLNIDTAYESLRKIKPNVAKWWKTGAQAPQMLTDKEVVMGITWNARIAAIQDLGAPVEIAWDDGTLRNDCWAVPKGAANRENAMKFIAFITMPIAQARLSMLIPYGFVNNKAAEYIPPERLAILPTSPSIRDRLVLYNYEWWADNRPKVIERWNPFVLS